MNAGYHAARRLARDRSSWRASFAAFPVAEVRGRRPRLGQRVHLEFDFCQSFQGELVAGSARICKGARIRNREGRRKRKREREIEDQNRRRGEERSALAWNFVLVLAKNFGSPSLPPPFPSPPRQPGRVPRQPLRRPPSAPLCCPRGERTLPRPVPLNKLVRSNDSYFFLVTRLPSFAPTRRLGRLRR